MTTPAPRPSEKNPARLDRPQRLGFLPTAAFWKRPDVWKIAGPWSAVFVVLWWVLIDLFAKNWIPFWASALLVAMGQFLFIAMLERYLRTRLRHRALGQGDGRVRAAAPEHVGGLVLGAGAEDRWRGGPRRPGESSARADPADD